MHRYFAYVLGNRIPLLLAALAMSAASNAWQWWSASHSPEARARQIASAAQIAGPALAENPAYLQYLLTCPRS